METLFSSICFVAPYQIIYYWFNLQEKKFRKFELFKTLTPRKLSTNPNPKGGTVFLGQLPGHHLKHGCPTNYTESKKLFNILFFRAFNNK